MKAFVLKDQLGDVKRGWIVKGWQPQLSHYDHKLIKDFGFSLEEVSVEDVLSDTCSEPVRSKSESFTQH